MKQFDIMSVTAGCCCIYSLHIYNFFFLTEILPTNREGYAYHSVGLDCVDMKLMKAVWLFVIDCIYWFFFKSFFKGFFGGNRGLGDFRSLLCN